MTKANFRHDKYDFDLAVYEINIEAVFFCFDGCLGFDPSQEFRIGRALDDHTRCGNRQREFQ